MYSMTWTRPDGTTLTIRYRFRCGSPPSYSPATGADGGEAHEVDVETVEDADGNALTWGELPEDEQDRIFEQACENAAWSYEDD